MLALTGAQVARVGPKKRALADWQHGEARDAETNRADWQIAASGTVPWVVAAAVRLRETGRAIAGGYVGPAPSRSAWRTVVAASRQGRRAGGAAAGAGDRSGARSNDHRARRLSGRCRRGATSAARTRPACIPVDAPSQGARAAWGRRPRGCPGDGGAPRGVLPGAFIQRAAMFAAGAAHRGVCVLRAPTGLRLSQPAAGLRPVRSARTNPGDALRRPGLVERSVTLGARSANVRDRAAPTGACGAT
jgi:hypothetical protein